MIESLGNLTIHPEGKGSGATSGDLLSHVLAQIRLTGDGVFPRTLVAEERLELKADEAHVIVSAAGAVYVQGEVPEAAVTVAEVDRLLGLLVAAAEEARGAV